MEALTVIIENAIAWAKERLGSKEYRGMCLVPLESVLAFRP